MFVSLYTVGAWMNDRRHAPIMRVGIIVGMGIWLIFTMAINEAAHADVAGALSP